MGALTHGFHGRLDRTVGGNDEDQRIRPLVFDLLHQVEPRYRPRHLEVSDDQVVVRLPEEGQGFGAVLRGGHLVGFAGQSLGQSRPDVRLVVHDQDAEVPVAHALPFLRSRGMVMSKVVPSGPVR